MDEVQRQLEEARTYFRGEEGLQRFLKAIIDKYCQLGRLGGTVHLKNLQQEEQKALGSLFKEDLTGQEEVRFTLRRFVKILNQTRFAGLDPVHILEAYAGQTLLTRQEKQERFQEGKSQLWQELREAFPHPHCQDWLAHIQEKGEGTGVVHTHYSKDPEGLKSDLQNVLKALASLPGESVNTYERLPLFATRITGDPHGFDSTTAAGRLLLHALQFLKHPSGSLSKSSLRTETISQLLEEFKLIRDDLNNFVICAGFRGEGPGGGVLEAAQKQGNVLILPLREVVPLKACYPYVLKEAFVVENPAVFSSLLDTGIGKKLPPLVCSNGQFRLATILFLQRLQEQGITLYYSGDFDPEGLQMAQNFLDRFPDTGQLWRMDIETYQSFSSTTPVPEHRLGKLNSLSHPALQKVAQGLKARKKAVYQEQILSLLQKDLEDLLFLSDA